MLRSALLLLAALTFNQGSASARPAVRPLRPAWRYLGNLAPLSLFVRLHNTSSSPLCISAIEVQEALRLFQEGRELATRDQGNRAILPWRGLDIVGGVRVIPPNRMIQLEYNLLGWKYSDGKVRARLVIPYVRCRDLFAAPKPVIGRQTSTFVFVAVPETAH